MSNYLHMGGVGGDWLNIAGWERYSASGTPFATTTVVDRAGFSSPAMRVILQKATSQGMSWDAIGVKPNTQYTVRARFDPLTTGSYNIARYTRDASDNLLVSDSTSKALTSGVPDTISHTFTTGPLAASTIIYLQRSGSVNDEYYVGDVTIQEAGGPVVKLNHVPLISGDIDVRCRVKLADWTPSSQPWVFNRHSDGTDDRCWALNVPPSGVIEFTWSPDGTAGNAITANSGVAPTVSDGAWLWIRATLDVDDGAGNHVVKFYTGGSGLTPTWVQLGATTTTAGTTSLHTSPLVPTRIGARGNGAGLMTGGVSHAQIYSGIDGTLVFDLDVTDWTVGEVQEGRGVDETDSIVAATRKGKTWSYVRPVQGGILSRAQALWMADDGNKGFSRKWADRSGNDHHAQLGSAAAPNAASPTFYDLDNGRRYLRLPGTAGNTVSTPDKAALDITGDLDVRWAMSMDDYTPAASQYVYSKRSNGGDDAYALFINSSGIMSFAWWNTTRSDKIATASLTTVVSDGNPIAVRATLDVDNGAGGHDVKFYTKTARTLGDLESDTGWTQLGATVTTAGTTSIDATTDELVIGDYWSTGGNLPFKGKIYGFVLKNGIGGTTVVGLDFTTWNNPATTHTDPQGNVWTLNKGTSGERARIVARAHWWLDTDDYFDVGDRAALRMGTSDFCLVAVFRALDQAVSRHFIAKVGGGGVAEIDALLTNLGQWSGRVANGPSSVGQPVTANDQDLYQEVVGVLRADRDGNAHAFANGTPGSAIDISGGSAVDINNAGTFTIGRRTVSTANYVEGEIYAIAVFRVVLSDAEIAALQSELLPGHPAFIGAGVW